MNDLRVGSAIRSVRVRRRLRQIDVAALAGVSDSLISRIERGHLDEMTVGSIRAVAAALEIRIDLTARWRAGDLDRLLNARHSELHELVARRFAKQLPDWVLQPEVSFAIYGERGIIDILAWHPRLRALLVIELKTDVADVNELVGTVDRKGRHAIRIAIDRGWIRPRDPPPTVSIWVIVANGHTNRRRIQAHGSMLRAAFLSMDGRSGPGCGGRIDPCGHCRSGQIPAQRRFAAASAQCVGYDGPMVAALSVAHKLEGADRRLDRRYPTPRWNLATSAGPRGARACGGRSGRG
jgi:transcriptional regulator with XRE-family HTH domain